MSNRNSKKREAEVTKDCDVVAKKSKTVCVFCLSSENDEMQLGEILRKEDLTCHYFCLLLASGLYQNAKPNEKSSLRGFLLNDIRNEVRRGYRLKCHYCQEKGATLGCCAKRCKRTFHLRCGRENGSLHQFFGGFGSYCDEHYLKQTLKDGDKCENTDDLACSICLGALEETLPSVNILHSPCCNNSWFHRNCIQQFAISAGKHHFRCPLCNCGKKFLKEMLHFGIYIPDQDASWERQSGAYGELLERHNTCDADICTCPQGRNHDAESGKYNLHLCSSCGSFGSHRTCRGLVWYESSLMCPFCAEIEKKFVEPERKARLKESMKSSTGTSNSQHEASTSSTMQEKVIHLEMADDGEIVDIDDDADIHVPPFLRNSLSRKILRRAVSLPSCSIVLQKVDKVVPLIENTVNITKIPGFTYYKRKGFLIRNKVGLKQRVQVTKRSKDCYPTNGNAQKTSCEIQEGERNESIEESSGKKSTLIKQFDENETQEQKIKSHIKNKRKGKKGKTYKTTTSKRKQSSKMMSKVRTSPLSSLKKQRALKFLMNFNQVAQKKCHRFRYGSKITSPIMNAKTVSLFGSEKKLVQSTLNFFKSPGNSVQTSENISMSTYHNRSSVKDIGSNDNSSLATINKKPTKTNIISKDVSSCKNKLSLVEVSTDNPSIATTPHKRAAKTNTNSKDVPSCKKSLSLGEKDIDNQSIATTRKRNAKTDKKSKNVSSGKKCLSLGEETIGNPQNTDKDISSCKKSLNLAEETADNSSIATTPRKRTAKTKTDKKSKNVSSGKKCLSLGEETIGNPQNTDKDISSCKKSLNLDEETIENSSIATTPHKRATKTDTISKDVSSCKKTVSSVEETIGISSIATTPHKRAANPDANSKNVSSCKKSLSLAEETTDNSSIATTPHKRAAKPDINSKDVSSCEKSLSLAEETADNSSIATTPHKRAAKPDINSKEVSSCKKSLSLAEETADNSSIATTPHKRADKPDINSKDVSSCKKSFILGEETTDNSSIATTPHKRAAKPDANSKNVSSCKKSLRLDEGTLGNPSIANTLSGASETNAT